MVQYFRCSRDLVLIDPGKAVRLRGSGVATFSAVFVSRSCDAADDVDDDDVTGSTSGSDIQCLSVVWRLAASVTGRGVMFGSLSSLVRSAAASCCL